MEIVGGRMQTLEEVGRAWFSPKEMFRVEGSFLAFVSKEFTAGAQNSVGDDVRKRRVTIRYTWGSASEFIRLQSKGGFETGWRLCCCKPAR